MSRLGRLLRRVVGRIVRRTRIDDRRSLHPFGRDEFKYCEDDHCLLVQLELLTGKTRRLLYPTSITNWLPPHEGEAISEARREEIVGTIWQFLNETGESTKIFGVPESDPGADSEGSKSGN